MKKRSSLQQPADALLLVFSSSGCAGQPCTERWRSTGLVYLVAGEPPRSAQLGARLRSIDESSIGAFNLFLTLSFIRFENFEISEWELTFYPQQGRLHAQRSSPYK